MIENFLNRPLERGTGQFHFQSKGGFTEGTPGDLPPSPKADFAFCRAMSARHEVANSERERQSGHAAEELGGFLSLAADGCNVSQRQARCQRPYEWSRRTPAR
jgi:hypothetical protein